jgi:hypothetical protein
VGLIDPATGTTHPVDSTPLTDAEREAALASPFLLGSFRVPGGDPIPPGSGLPGPAPVVRPNIPQTPDVLGSIFDTFGSIGGFLVNNASDIFGLLGTFIGGGQAPTVPQLPGTPQQPGAPLPPGTPVPVPTQTPKETSKVGFFDTALATVEGLLRQAPGAINVAQQLGFLPQQQPIINLGGQPSTQGGFAPVSAPIALPGGAQLAGLDLNPFFDVAPQGAVCISPRATGSFRLPARVDVPVPNKDGTMRFTTYRNMGAPVLFAGDFAAAKRVKRVGAKARRRSGGR